MSLQTASAPISPPARPWLRLLLIVILSATFALRLHELPRQNIWWDEARNIDVALRPFAQIASAPELDIQPPFYYWLLHSWLNLAGVTRGADPSQLAYLARFLSVLAGLIGTALIYPLGKRFFTARAGLYALVLAALSPFWLAESQETRMYTLGFALLSGAALAFYAALESRRYGIGDTGYGIQDAGCRIRDAGARTPHAALRGGAWALYLLFVALSTLALLTHYNALFVVVTWYGWWGVWALTQRDRWPQLRIVLICGVAMSLLLTPIVPIALRQIPTYANPNLTVPTIAQYLSANWQAYLGGYAFDPAFLAGNGISWLWLTLMLTISGLCAGFISRNARAPSGRTTHHSQLITRNSREPSGRTIHNSQFTIHNSQFTIHNSQFTTFPLVWVIGSLTLYYIAVLDRGAFNVRYSSFVTPALYLLIGGALAGWGMRWLGKVAFALAIAGMIPGLWADLYDARFAREDIVGVTNWLREVAGPDDLILVDQKYPFGFYYQRYTIAASGEPVGPEAAPARYLFVDVNTLDRQLTQWAVQSQQVFWVQWFESDTDPRHAVPFLLNQAGRQVGAQHFQGYTIDWWQLQPPNHFELAPAWTTIQFRFPPALETVAIALPIHPIAPGQGVPVVIRWQRLPSDLTRPYKARVALYDAADARLAQSDERLLNDRHVMPAEWAAADQPLNVYWLPTADDLAEGSYDLRLLVYDAETLEPLSLVDDAGNPNGLEATLGTVEIRRGEW